MTQDGRAAGEWMAETIIRQRLYLEAMSKRG